MEKVKKKKGGYMPGGGRPKGSKSKTTIEREQILEQIKATIAGRATKIVESQTVAAFGTHRVLRLTRDLEGKITNSSIVFETSEIDRLISAGEYGRDYIFASGADPDWRAGESLLNRTFGKPKDTLELLPPLEPDENLKESVDNLLTKYLNGGNKKTTRTK